MTFYKLEQLCSLLWGQSWQTELANALDIDRRTVSKWKTQGVAKWVDARIPNVVRKRKLEVLAVEKWVEENINERKPD